MSDEKFDQVDDLFLPQCPTCEATVSEDSVNCPECGFSMSEKISILSRLKTAAVGFGLLLISAYGGYRYMLLPLQTGVFSGIYSSRVYREDSPVWFWIHVIFEGAIGPLMFFVLGLGVFITGLTGTGEVGKISFRTSAERDSSTDHLLEKVEEFHEKLGNKPLGNKKNNKPK